MKLSEYNKKGDEYTGKASEIVRQLLLGGIAFIWVFKETDGPVSKLDAFLFYPAIAICLGLLVDLLQYVIAGYIWKRFFRINERRVTAELRASGQASDAVDAEIKSPKVYGNLIYVFYYSKILLLVISYTLLIKYIIDRLNFV